MRHLDVTEGKFKELTELRAKSLSRVRQWFNDNNYTEVTCPHITGATGSCEWFPNAMDVNLFDENDKDKEMYMRQTAQLYLEAFTQIHDKVYTIGPSFRQERGVSPRHLSEFTLIEFEQRNIDLYELMNNIEDAVKSIFSVGYDFLANKDWANKGLKWPRVKYREAINKLNEDGAFPIPFGHDLKADHEKWLCEYYSGPIFITHYPVCLNSSNPNQVIKFFSMKRDLKAQETICADLLLPNVGESVGSAVREGRVDICRLQLLESIMYQHMKEKGIGLDHFKWYFDVLNQANGGSHSSGCGIGFERVIQCVLGSDTIKDSIEIPRASDYLLV